jgi:uncharacterized membrane protein YkvA (DUF1232 family)
MKNYYDFLKHELDNFQGDFDKFILYIPDFFKLLCDLLDEDFDKQDRRIINSALAYFVVPNDVIPEEIYGPMGYVDDVFVCVKVLKKLQEKYGLQMLARLWNCDEELDEVLDYSYEKSLEILKEQNVVEHVLEYAGVD